MTLLPVIARELRTSARHPFTYYLRGLGAGALIVASGLFGLQHSFGPTLGGLLFGNLHFTLFWAIWILVPLLTVDSLSRERREGTLGLLFLTRLKASDVVVAKGLVHGLRALTLWLAVLPVAAIPMLLGGVSWKEAAASVCVNFSSIFLALGAGLLASSLSKTWPRAMTFAVMLCFVVGSVFVIFHCFCFVIMIVAFGLGGRGGIGWPTVDQFMQTAFMLVLRSHDFWSQGFGSLPPRAQSGWLVAEVIVMLCSLFGAFLLVKCAAWSVQRRWREEPPSARQLWWEKTFCTPFLWLSFFHRWMRAKLERNPIGWLQQRTWTGRLVTWGWFAVIISIYSAVLTDPNFFRGSSSTQRTMAWLLAGSMALSAVGSFRRERENGVLELLLVSPLGERDIITGRLLGLWGQFLPAMALLLGIWSLFSDFLPNSRDAEAILFFAVTFLTVPIIGLLFALLCRNFLPAFLSTLAVGLLLPLVLPGFLGFTWWGLFLGPSFAPSVRIHLSIWGSLLQLGVAAFCWHRLDERLKQRSFPLERTEV